MLDGEIQTLVADKGFGFIKSAGSGDGVFFHCSVVDAPFETLSQGQHVQYELDSKVEKPRALRVLAGKSSAGRQSSRPGGRASRPGNRPAGTANRTTRTGGRPSRPGDRAARSRAGQSANTRSRDSGRTVQRAGIEYGFIVKLHRRRMRGFISSVKHGPEFVFAAESVTGEKRFSRLEIGDYVEFRIGERDPEDPKQAVAKAVRVAKLEEKELVEKRLARHPNARKKKPSWR